MVASLQAQSRIFDRSSGMLCDRISWVKPQESDVVAYEAVWLIINFE